MRTLYSAFGGAATITEDAGVVSANFDASLGGGKAAGIIKGQGSIEIGVVQGIEDLAEAEVNAFVQSKLPAALPFIQAIESYGNAKLEAAE